MFIANIDWYVAEESSVNSSKLQKGNSGAGEMGGRGGKSIFVLLAATVNSSLESTVLVERIRFYCKCTKMSNNRVGVS